MLAFLLNLQAWVNRCKFYFVLCCFLVFKACNYSILVFYFHKYIFLLFQIMSAPAASLRKCLNNRNSFCYICGNFIIPSQRANISAFVKEAYFAYYKVKHSDQDRSWVTHRVCKQYVEGLFMWNKGTCEKLAFGITMVSREQKDLVFSVTFR